MTLTAEQLEMRRKGLGASDVANILDGKLMQVWLDKLHPQEREQTPAQKRGHWLEDTLARRWACDEGLVLRPGPMETLVHPELPWVMATPDAIGRHATPNGAERLGEMKTTRQRLSEDICEPRYAAQARWQLAVVAPLMKITRCDVVAWDMHEEEPYYYRIDRDKALEDELIEAMADIWETHFVKGVEPPPDASQEYSRYLSRLPSLGKTLKVDALHPITQQAKLYRHISEERDQWDELKVIEGNKLKHMLLELDMVETPIGRIYYKDVKGTTKTDWETIARRCFGMITEADPTAGKCASILTLEALVKEHTTTAPSYRKLNPKWKTDE